MNETCISHETKQICIGKIQKTLYWGLVDIYWTLIMCDDLYVRLNNIYAH